MQWVFIVVCLVPGAELGSEDTMESDPSLTLWRNACGPIPLPRTPLRDTAVYPGKES